jgi:glycerol-3-phosphate acyltransferase PlsX
MGGDNAPQAVIDGAVVASRTLGCEITLVGDAGKISKAIASSTVREAELCRFNIAGATETIDMHDDPVLAIRVKKDSSMVVGLKLLRDGGGDAFVSAGSTGALLTGATLIVKRVRGIKRASLAPLLPSSSGGVLVIDAGANVECTAEQLLQFAFMGSFYAEGALGIKNPRVGLLNNGTEETKGDPLRLETYALLAEAGKAGKINFIGNVEGRDPMLGACDVVVCDGFTGNVFLKASEGAALFVMRELKQVLFKNKKSKLASLLVRKGLNLLRNRANPDAVGGTIMLGISKPVVKAHGSSNADAIVSAITQSIRAVNAGVAERLAEHFSRFGAEADE